MLALLECVLQAGHTATASFDENTLKAERSQKGEHDSVFSAAFGNLISCKEWLHMAVVRLPRV